MATYTVEDFKKQAKKVEDEYSADRMSLSWLRLAAMDNGDDGDRASELLDVVEKLLHL